MRKAGTGQRNSAPRAPLAGVSDGEPTEDAGPPSPERIVQEQQAGAARYVARLGRNHFDVILDLADPATELGRRTLDLLQ